jgi:dTDP-4-amino-4,6-dideoxygalactose transaminase
MEVLPLRVEQRRSVFQFYVDRFGSTPGITFQPEAESNFSNRWLTCLLIDPAQTGGLTREHLRLHLEKDNIESRPLWKPMHQQPIFADAPYYGDGTSERLFDQGLCLPSGSNLSDQDLERVAARIEEALALQPA